MTQLELACRYILLVWGQYGHNTDGSTLYHGHMAAGQWAGGFLKDLGYVEEAGEKWRITPKGRALMDREFS